jgi:hypothetical protein
MLIGPRHELVFRPARLTLTLAGVALLLVLASIASQAIQYGLRPELFRNLIRFFYVEAEANLPTCFASALLLISALLVLAIAALKRKEQAPFARHWAVLSATFLFMAIDETASLHELLTYPLRDMLGVPVSGLLYFTWVVAGLAGSAVFAGVFLNFFRHLPARFRMLVVLAAGLFLGGAIGMEMVGGSYASRHGSSNFTYSMLATLEESMELAGSILFIYTWLTYLEWHFGAVRVCLSRSAQA